MPRHKAFRMVGGALGGICPPGFWCMDTVTMIVCGIVLAVVAVGAIYLHKNGSVQKPTVIVVNSKPSSQEKEQVQQIQQQSQYVDPRFAPLSPERSFFSPPDIRGQPIAAGLGPMIPTVPINVQTRGLPDTFQQIGVLTTPGGSSTSATPNRTIIPLFGRQLTTNRDRWNYYTRTDGMNPVQVPVQYKRRNCDGDNGCDEILDGESVAVPIMGQSFTANVYRYSTPRYIPI